MPHFSVLTGYNEPGACAHMPPKGHKKGTPAPVKVQTFKAVGGGGDGTKRTPKSKFDKAAIDPTQSYSVYDIMRYRPDHVGGTGFRGPHWLVRWDDWEDSGYDTWEPAANLPGALRCSRSLPFHPEHPRFFL